MQGWDSTFDGLERATTLCLQIGHSMKKAASIRMRRGLKYLALGAELHQASGIHYCDAVRDLRNYGEIMRDEKHGQAEFRAQLSEQFEDLRLNGDVERRGGLVGNQQLGTVHDGHGDHYPLPHAAGKLVRIIAGASVGFGDGDVIHGLNGKSCRAVDLDWLPCASTASAICSPTRITGLSAVIGS